MTFWTESRGSDGAIGRGGAGGDVEPAGVAPGKLTRVALEYAPLSAIAAAEAEAVDGEDDPAWTEPARDEPGEQRGEAAPEATPPVPPQLPRLDLGRRTQVSEAELEPAGGGGGGPTQPTPEPRGQTDTLVLGANEVYREALLIAQRRTGIDAAALAALIDAEAAKDGARWNKNSRAGTSSATGLTQFIDSTWLLMARTPGTLLHETALAKGYARRGTGGVAITDRGALLALRFDPVQSIVAAAEYGRINLEAMARDGVVPANLTDDERAKYMYIGHHEGHAGGVVHYTDSATCTEEQAATALGNFKAGRALRKQHGTAREAYRVFAGRFSRSKFPAQVGKKGGAIIQRYLDAHGGSWEHAYRAWLRDYANRKIQPDRFREKRTA